jgi:hypothetical protein
MRGLENSSRREATGVWHLGKLTHMIGNANQIPRTRAAVADAPIGCVVLRVGGNEALRMPAIRRGNDLGDSPATLRTAVE